MKAVMCGSVQRKVGKSCGIAFQEFRQRAHRVSLTPSTAMHTVHGEELAARSRRLVYKEGGQCQQPGAAKGRFEVLSTWRSTGRLPT